MWTGKPLGAHEQRKKRREEILERHDFGEKEEKSMSTVYGRAMHGDRTLGVKCDICGEVYWTDLTGQSFPEHIRESVQNGWRNIKQNGKWLNLCPECNELMRKKKKRRENDGRLHWLPMERQTAEMQLL